MPLGYLVTVVVLGLPTLLCVRPVRSPRWAALWSWRLSFVLNEVPLLALLWLAAATALAVGQGDLGAVGWAAGALVAVGLLVVVARARRGLPASSASSASSGPSRSWRTVVAYPFRPRSLERRRDIAYGPKPGQVLDLVVRRGGPPGPGPAPVFVYLHGGGFTSGHNAREGRPLQHRLAADGWLVVDADYRLWPAVRWGDQVDDVRAVLRWVRNQDGVDRHRIVVGGSSAGAHLAATVALTDFEVAACVGLYGFYDEAEPEEGGTTTPRSYRRADAPPFVIVHGDQDTHVPVAQVRSFVAELQAVHEGPVRYVELPGAQHGFDVFHSIRNDRVVDFLARYLADVRSEVIR